MFRRLLLTAAASGAVLVTGGPAAAQSAADFYEQHCAACHTIGQGAVAGPDLRDVTKRRDREWLIRFLIDPDDFRSDPAVAQMIKDAGGMEMPTTEGITRDVAIALLQLIEQRSASAAAYATTEGATEVAPYDAPYVATAADIAQGRDLFAGRRRLIAAGPACVQCHDAVTLEPPGGGRLGPDLTQATRRLGGARGVAAWLAAAPTPVMRAVYRSASLTPEEARVLAAFLEEAAARAPAPATTRLQPLFAATTALVLFALSTIGLLGSRRFRGVRAQLVARGHHRPAAAGGPR